MTCDNCGANGESEVFSTLDSVCAQKEDDDVWTMRAMKKYFDTGYEMLDACFSF